MQTKEGVEKFMKHSDCVIRHVLDRFGDKWSILIIMLLGNAGKLRFNEINQQIGDISQKMLTVTLRSLEADGLVNRELYPEIPPRVEYELTDMGRSLLPHIETLSTWAKDNLACIIKSREAYEARKQKA